MSNCPICGPTFIGTCPHQTNDADNSEQTFKSIVAEGQQLMKLFKKIVREEYTPKVKAKRYKHSLSLVERIDLLE